VIPAIPLPWKILIVLAVAAGIYVKGRVDGNEAQENAYMRETLVAQKKADDLANELVIAQASAMAVTEKKVVQYVDRIRTVQAPDTACSADPRMQLGNYGVRSLLSGTDAERSPPAAVQGPGAGARPR
jgi:hypothetical protein